MKKIIIFIAILCVLSVRASGQDSLTVVLRANPGKESIQLRWAVDKPYQWQKSLKFGYTIERYTLKRNGKLLDEKEKIVLTPNPIVTAPLHEWEQIAQKNNYAAILAQALYGETFEVTGIQSNDIMSIVNQSEEREQRHAFALTAADLCFDCACLAGWGYEDKNVVKGEYYLYRVIPVGEGVENWNIQYGFAYTGIDDYRNLPKTVGLSAEFGDRVVKLQWNTSLFDRIFCAWQIEKSEDNNLFEPIGLPVTPWDEKATETMIIDSLAENGKTYYYRVRGISIFGETGQASDVVSGRGTEALKSNPVITKSLINQEGIVEITWEFDEAAQHLIQSFELHRSDTGSGTFLPVKTDIPVNERFLAYDGTLKSSNYFIIAAKPAHGDKPVQSFPVLVMPVDSFPPATPVQLTAQTDTLGRVFLKWTANTESDLLGYKLYRGHVKGEELIPVTNNTVLVNQYIDTVDLKNLNTHVYYALKAIDTHYNQSSFSKIIEVEKPLKIKPSQPVFDSYKVESEGIFLSWINSPGSEVSHHTLYRATTDSMKYRPVMEFRQDSITTFLDKNVENGIAYSYVITAQSRWGVESDPSPALQATASPSDKPIVIKQFKSISDKENKQIKLTWKTVNSQKIKSWKIYRAENDEPISLWQDLPVGTTTTEDTNLLRTGHSYHYMIHAIMVDGGNSQPEKISVIY